jgi:carboxylesterase
VVGSKREDHSLLFRGSSARGRTGVLLIHGLGGTPLELKTVARGLAARGWTVSCCQLAGHCGTEDDLLATTWADWFASAERAMAELERECDTILVGGLSIGAMIALRLAALNPDRVHGSILLAPTLWYDGWAVPWYRFMLKLAFQAKWLKHLRFAERPPYGIKDEGIRAVVAGAMLSGKAAEAGLTCTPLGALREADELVRDVKERLGSIVTPALIVHPREDDISDLSNAIYLQRRLGGLAECLVLDDSYHIVTVDRQRDILIDRAANFIEFVERRIAGAADTGARVVPLTKA